MNTHFFASAVGRWVAPSVLAASTFCGAMGVSSVASAQERVVVAAPVPRVVVEGPRVVAPRVVVERPVVERPVVAPLLRLRSARVGWRVRSGWGRGSGTAMAAPATVGSTARAGSMAAAASTAVAVHTAAATAERGETPRAADARWPPSVAVAARSTRGPRRTSGRSFRGLSHEWDVCASRTHRRRAAPARAGWLQTGT